MPDLSDLLRQTPVESKGVFLVVTTGTDARSLPSDTPSHDDIVDYMRLSDTVAVVFAKGFTTTADICRVFSIQEHGSRTGLAVKMDMYTGYERGELWEKMRAWESHQAVAT